MQKKINIGVIGCAKIADRYVIPAINELTDNFHLAGVASRDKIKAEIFAEKFNTKPFYGYKELIDSGNLDAIYIPLPNAQHYEWIEKALEKNLHVLVEKSLTCSLSETLKLMQIAKEKGLAIIENFQFRFHPQLNTIKELLSENKIGDIRCIRSSFGFPPFPDSDNIRYQKQLGGGALLDAGAYPVKISQIILGEDLEVESAFLSYNPDLAVDIWGGAFLRAENCFSEIAFGFDNYYQCNLEIWGSKGKITADRIFTAPPGFEPKIFLEGAKGKNEINIPASNHFKNMLTYFYSIIESNKFEEEYKQNIQQSRLLEQIKIKANGE